MTSPPAPKVISSRIKEHWIGLTCSACKTEVEYFPASVGTSGEAFAVACAKCGEHNAVNVAKAKAKQAAKRRIGTDERPLDTSFYEILGLSVTCTQDEVKKAYRRLAIIHHPDKNPNDPTAGERFKDIAVAYATLSDPGLRHAYNEFGKGKGDGQDQDAMVDPEAIFSQLFGGERFQDIIGTISLGTEMKSAMQDDEEEDANEGVVATAVGPDGKPRLTAEQQAAVDRKKEAKRAAEEKVNAEKAKVREARVADLVERLRTRLAVFTEQAAAEDDQQIASGVKTMWTMHAEELKQESYGVELLHAVGFVYKLKSEHYLASTGIVPFGIGGWFHSAKSTAHIINQTVSTVRSAYALKDVFEAIAAAEKSGLSDDKKKELEDKAAQMGLHALFKGAKLEVESVIREVCDRLLSEKAPVADLRKRAVAIGILGECFSAVVKDETCNPPLGQTMPGGAPAAPKAK